MSRIAYIFFGQVKNFDKKQCEAFQYNVGDKLKHHDVDYFLTTSRSTRYNSPRQQEAEGRGVLVDPESMHQYFDFKDVFYDDQSRESENISGLAQKLVTFGDAWNSHSLTSTENSLKQLYGLEYFWHQFKGIAKNYDVFILSRCDLFHTHVFDVDCLNKDVDLLTPYYDGFEEIDYGQFGGLNDRFAVAKNVLSLAVYCSRYSGIKNKPQYYHAEEYLKQQVEYHKLTTDKIHNFCFLLYRANCKISDLVGIENDEQMNTNLNGIDKSYFINLDRRLDRLNQIYKNNPFFAQRISAIDAKKIELSDEIKKLFKTCFDKLTKAEISCSLSHYSLWKKLAEDPVAENYLILEDDVVFKDGFVKFWNQVFSKQIPSNYNLIYLGGCQPWNKPHYSKVLERYNDYFCNIKENDCFTKGDHYFHMNAQSYIMSKKGAKLICDYVETYGFDLQKTQAQDIFMINFFNKNKLFEAPKSIYHLNPLMSYQLHEENNNTEIDKNSDLRYAEERFKIKQEDEMIQFPLLAKIYSKQIPKKIHLSWKNKNVLNSNYSLIKKGAKNLELLNPDWDIEVSDDEGVNRYIRDNIGKSSWELIKDRKITEKTDLWRLLKIYKEGGLYVDIDRYIDTPLSEIIKANTSCVIPTFQDIDFSQDFVLSCANNPMIERAISNNLFNRKNRQNLFYTAVCSYMHAASEFLGGQKVERGDNPVYFNDIRKQIEACEYLETFREIGPEYHTLYRNTAGDFDAKIFEKDKADFYNGESVIHWNADTQAKHTQLKNTNKQKLIFLQHNLFEEDFISELFEDCDVIYDTEMNRVIDDSVIVYSNGSSTENVWKYSDEIAQNLFDFQNKLRNYFEQCKNKNCILVHLGDEHCHAEIDYYQNFKHVFRQYYRKDATANNLTFIPLGYKKGFSK
jgi:GR25 family glycosyltransferase involved in LPS biosynthesis